MLLAVTGAWVASTCAVIVGLVMTGALHEDGLADTADALGGGHDRESVLRILKDSRVGVFGAVALIMTLLLRVGLLVRLGPHAPVALVLAAVLSRLSPVWLMGTMRDITPVSTSRFGPVMAVGAAYHVRASEALPPREP